MAQSSAVPDPFGAAVEKWPFLAQYPHVYSNVPGRTNLESWPIGESGTKEYPRPQGLPPDKFGLEIFDRNIRPDDVLADAVSHGMRFDDNAVRLAYDRFSQSITPQQEGILRRQYQWYRLNSGEVRPYDAWRSMSGLPGMFRGYAFNQWGDADDPNWYAMNWYTPEQRTLLDEMMQNLNNRKYQNAGPNRANQRPDPGPMVGPQPAGPTR
jgi:hypothetical protein